MSCAFCCCSVARLCLTLCDPIGCGTPGFPVFHYFLEPAQTHVHWIGDAIQPSPSLCSLLFQPSIFPSIRVFSNELALRIRWPKYWTFSFSINLSNEYSGLVSFRIDWLVSLQFKRLSSVFSNITGLCYGKSEKRWSYSCTQWSLTKENWWEKEAICMTVCQWRRWFYIGLAKPFVWVFP